MDLTIHASFLPHHDPDASLAFWRDTLGFAVRDDVGYRGLRWITVGAFERLQAGGAPGGPGNPPYPSRARRRSVTATRSRTTWRPAERSSGSRSGALEYVVHRARGRSSNGRSEHEANSKDEANAEVEANAEEMTTTRASRTQSSQRGEMP
jgi:catechol 2,3-dioxygenase-like lactoylglutathione lyase family enzyme